METELRRFALAADRHPVALWIASLTMLAALWFGTILPFLGHYPSVSGDVVWNMSVSYKLLTDGVLGSDLFVGFFNTDQHYFLNLPLHHLWQALSFRLFGEGILQARVVSVVMAMLVVVLVSGLALRWYGWKPAVLCASPLVFWRSDITGIGIPLLSVGRTGRSDMEAVLWIWVVVGLLAWYRQRASNLTAFLIGVSCGLASLTQIVGPFSFFIVIAAWLTWHGRRVLTTPATYAVLAGSLLTLGPYIFYVGQHTMDFVGQRLKDADRRDFLNLSFYSLNIIREPGRYAPLFDMPGQTATGYQALSPWLVGLGVLPVLQHLLARYRLHRQTGEFLLLTTIAVLAVSLLLFEQTKAPLYAAPLVPAICLGFAVCLTDLSRWLGRPDRSLMLRRGGTTILALVLTVVFVEGAGTHVMNWRRAQRPDNYQRISQRLTSLIPADGHVIGFERWWWPLRHRPTYLSWGNLVWQWHWHNIEQSRDTSLLTLVEQTPADYLIVTYIEPIYMRPSPVVMQRQFEQLTTTCTTEIDSWTDDEYGQLTVYRLLRDEAGRLQCRAEQSRTASARQPRAIRP